MTYPVPYISYSQLSSFIDCPYTYYSTYILKNRSGNKFTALGSAVHTIAEIQGKQLIANNPYEDGKYIQMFNEIYFDNEKTPKKYFTDKEEFIQLYKKGIVAIENYLNEYRESKPLFIEKKFRSVLIEGTPECLGFIDRIDGDIERPWEWVVTDIKSGSNPKSKQFLNDDFQLAIYAQFIYNQYGHYPAFLRYAHPVPNKFQTAIHLGDGLYKYDYKGQRSPKACFSVTDKMLTVKKTVEAISVAYANNDFPKQTDRFKCQMCFHKGTCKPFEGGGWNNL